MSPEATHNWDLSEYADLKSAYTSKISKGGHHEASRLTLNTLEDADAQEIVINTHKSVNNSASKNSLMINASPKKSL